MKLKIFIYMCFSIIAIRASEHEVPELLRQAGFTHIDFIPKKLTAQLALLKNESDWLNYHVNYPVTRYHYDDKSIERMNKAFDEIQSKEQLLSKEQTLTEGFFKSFRDAIWSPKSKEQQEFELLKAYLELAENDGCPSANHRIACAFKNGELGLPQNEYWYRAFSDRPSTIDAMKDEQSDVLKYLMEHGVNTKDLGTQSQQDLSKLSDATYDSGETTAR
ncbi:MAG: hypothetical protein Q8S21_04085, partial [Candidatus Paracaedibacteraceae bacterium]|nr:hypothetical protein [Candidatus Paracaedibacteraceae bacterium]